ncbi:MspA family porin [Nocardia cyriacigeorgica]|uniref:MspA family porin n=1 Tax=Nocardia cyriacigeorgica TaxID=135487 RepID=UPI00245515F0|nr:MspA family porin [Nocardia cyriacigeorgica]
MFVGLVAGVGAVTAVALPPVSAVADSVESLPGGELTRTLADGTRVTVRLIGESVTLSPSMGATPLHRNAWVSGSARVELSGSADGARIAPGYVVGCQVHLGGADSSVGGSAGVAGRGEQPTASAAGGANLSLGPGRATSFQVLDLERTDDYGNESHRGANRFTGTSGSVTWADQTIGLDGCAGYAQARAFVVVGVETASVTASVTLWGRPFSLG